MIDNSVRMQIRAPAQIRGVRLLAMRFASNVLLCCLDANIFDLPPRLAGL